MREKERDRMGYEPSISPQPEGRGGTKKTHTHKQHQLSTAAVPENLGSYTRVSQGHGSSHDRRGTGP